MIKKNTKHCCTLMEKFTTDPRIGIYYNPITRDYTINLISSNATQSIYNCPWCGSKLPYCLDNKYEEILNKEYNILYNPSAKSYYEILEDPSTYKEINRELPKEFKSDTWWKKRGL